MKKASPNPITSKRQSQVSDVTLRRLIGYSMKRAFNVVKADLVSALKPFELRMLTYTALVLIVDNPGVRQSQLADAMDIERPNLVVIIDELEERDLIVRERVPTDRRAYALKVTLAGRQLYEKSVAAVEANEAALLDGISSETHELVMATLKQIERNQRRG